MLTVWQWRRVQIRGIRQILLTTCIRHEYTTPHSSEKNKIAKRMHRTIQERLVAMLQHSRPSDGFWVEALLTTVHIINMSPSRPLRLEYLGNNGMTVRRITTSWGFSKARHTTSYQKMIVENVNQGPGNIFSLAMDQTAKSDIDSRPWEQTNHSKFGRSVQQVGYA